MNYPWIAAELQHLAVPIEDLQHDPANAKRHDEQNIRAVKRSLRREGQYHPLLVNANNGQVVIGNCRLTAARRLGWSHVAAILKPMTPAEQARLGLQDNRTGELGEWDLIALDAAIEIIEQADPDQADLLILQLSLDELRKKSREKGIDGETGPELEGLEYRIIVLCDGEAHQASLLARLEEEGLNCQALIS